MNSGFPWSETFIRDMADKEFRDEFVAEKIRSRIAMLIRALREQPERDWSQTRLGQEMSKPQSVISRIEDPDYGKLSLQTLLEVAAAFDLPLWVDIPEWEDWFRLIRDVPNSQTSRRSFDADQLCEQAKIKAPATQWRDNVVALFNRSSATTPTAPKSSGSPANAVGAMCA